MVPTSSGHHQGHSEDGVVGGAHDPIGRLSFWILGDARACQLRQARHQVHRRRDGPWTSRLPISLVATARTAACARSCRPEKSFGLRMARGYEPTPRVGGRPYCWANAVAAVAEQRQRQRDYHHPADATAPRGSIRPGRATANRRRPAREVWDLSLSRVHSGDGHVETGFARP